MGKKTTIQRNVFVRKQSSMVDYILWMEKIRNSEEKIERKLQKKNGKLTSTKMNIASLVVYIYGLFATDDDWES